MTDTRIEWSQYALNPDGFVCVLQEYDRFNSRWVTILDGPETGVRRFYDQRNLRALATLAEPEPSAEESGEVVLTERVRQKLSTAIDQWREHENEGEDWQDTARAMFGAICEAESDLSRGASPVEGKPEAEEREKLTLVWDRHAGQYVGPTSGERTNYYNQALQFSRGEAGDVVAGSRGIYALADLSGWVKNWGEQPVGDGTEVEVKTITSRIKSKAFMISWDDTITHFRLPLPVEEFSTEDASPELPPAREISMRFKPYPKLEPMSFTPDDGWDDDGPDALVRETVERRAREQAATLEEAAEEKVRRIVREELAADHRRMADMYRNCIPQGITQWTIRDMHDSRADELEGGE